MKLRQERERRPNYRAALDAATTFLLHSQHHWRRASGRGSTAQFSMRVFGTSRSGDKGCKLILGAVALLGFLAALGGITHEGYSKSELFVIFGSLAVALYYVSQILGWRKKRPR
jgi:hypothetical protein